jgi:hypothetical protein
MSSFDLSAPMRQGITFIGNKEYWASFFKMFTMLGKSGRANYDYLMRQIGNDPDYELMLLGRLSFSELDGKLSNREEDFQTDIARKIPLLGIGVAQSEQAYAGFLNKLRADMFKKFVNQYKGNEIPDKPLSQWTPEEKEATSKLLKDIGSFVNSSTGRAELKGSIFGTEVYNFTSAAPQLNQAFFSSRLIQSRFNMLNPIYYANLNPKVRMQAIKEMVKMGTVLNLVAWSLLLIPGAFEDEEYKFSLDPNNENFLRFSQGESSVNLDARSTDFLKIKEGDTRFDIAGGYGQYLTLGARTSLWLSNAVTGWDIPEEVSTNGKEKLYGENRMFDKSYLEEVLRFGRNKLSPNVSYFVDAFAGSNVIGTEFNVLGSAASRMVPMYVSSTVEIAQQEGVAKGVRYSIPAVFGVGVNSFVAKTRDPDQTLEAPADYKEVPLRGEAKDWWEATLNNYFKTLVFTYTAETGFDNWNDLPKKAQEEIIAAAKKDAQQYTREDAEEYLVPKE